MARMSAIAVGFVLLLSTLEGGYSLQADENLSCIQNVKRFSTGDSPRHYYECTGTKGGKPRLVQCPDDLYYHTNKQTCVPKSQYAAPEAKNVQALGRTLQLGTVYDARTNMFFPETSFWRKETIDNAVQENPAGHTSYEVYTDQRTKSKMESMDIEASLSMDFMSGMVHVGGSGRYFEDKVSDEYEVNVELTYDATVIKKLLAKTNETDFPDECGNEQYTHVVMGVTYGINCVFVFKSLQTTESDASSVSGNLEASIKNIPQFSVSGEGQVNLTDSQQKTMENTYIRMFGDISPKYPLPATFDQAVEFYGQIPEMISHTPDGNLEGATIVELHLLPITDTICGNEERILNEISNHMMTEVKNMLDELELLNMEAGVLHDSIPAQKFKPLRENLNIYRKALKSFEIEKKRKLQEILPNIRGGTGHGEDALINLILAYDASQFMYDKSHSFLRDRRREVNAIMVLVDYFGEETNLGLADYENANDVEYIFERDFVIVLEVNILTPESLTINFLNGKPVNESGFWYNDIATEGELGGLLRRYHAFALDNVDQEDRGYLLKISPYDSDTAYKMNAFVKGVLIPGIFDVPEQPEDEPKVTQINHDGFQFKLDKQNDFVIGVRVMINDILDDQLIEQDILFPEDATTGDDVEVKVVNLKMAKVYSFSVKYLTEVGTSPASPVTKKLNTSPMSAPTHITTENVTESSITVTWGKPTFYAPGIEEADIQYKITITSEDGTATEKTTPNLEYTFNDLTDATQYQFKVTAVYDDLDLPDIGHENTESAPVNLVTFSSPLAPTIEDPTEVYEHNAVVTWSPPASLGTGVEIVNYVLQYSVSGSDDIRQIVVPENHCELTDLAMAAVYQLAVKVVTTEGQSSFSSQAALTTKYKQTVMGELRDQVYGAMGDIVDNIRRETRICASKASTKDEGIVKYDSVITNVNNVDGAGLDPSTGLFTAGWAGSYQVVANMEMVASSSEQSVWVVVNENKVEQSFMHFRHEGNNFGKGVDNGSRDIILDLNVGDTVGLTYETNGNGEMELKSVNFCVTSLMISN